VRFPYTTYAFYECRPYRFQDIHARLRWPTVHPTPFTHAPAPTDAVTRIGCDDHRCGAFLTITARTPTTYPTGGRHTRRRTGSGTDGSLIQPLATLFRWRVNRDLPPFTLPHFYPVAGDSGDCVEFERWYHRHHAATYHPHLPPPTTAARFAEHSVV